MIKRKYIKPSLSQTMIQADSLLVSSPTVGLDHTEGAWEADANKESGFGSIWDDSDNSIW